MNIIVIAKVHGISYLTKVYEVSLIAAEHMILDMGICGRHTNGVEGCIAFDSDGMKTDTFIGEVLHSTPVELERLKEIIAKRNEEIMKKDVAETKVAELEKAIERMTEELEEYHRILAE